MSVAWYTHTSIAVTSIVVTSRGRHRHRALPPLAHPLVPPRAPPPLAPPTCPSSCPPSLLAPGPIACTGADCLHRGRSAQQPESARQLTCHHVLPRKRPTAHLLPRAAEKAPGSPFATACRRESAWQPTCRRVPSRLPAPGLPRKRPAARLPSRAAENAPGSPLAAACRRESGTGSPLVTACRRESARQPTCRHVPIPGETQIRIRNGHWQVQHIIKQTLKKRTGATDLKKKYI